MIKAWKISALAALLMASWGHAEEKLVIYTARSEQLNNMVIEHFEKDTGIKTELVVAGTGPLLKRVESEKDNPNGDIFWAADETMLFAKKDLFDVYISPENEHILPQFRNKTGHFSAAFSDPTVFIVNHQSPVKVEGFADLLQPELKGKIAFGDPANSSSAFQCLMAMLYAHGKNHDPMSEEAWAYVDKFIAQLDGKILNSSGGVHKGVADGEYMVGLTWEDPAANYVKNGAKVSVVFPKEGAIFPGESVQIIKGSKNKEQAQRFVDYLLGEKVQNLVGENLTVRPLREGAKLASYMKPQSEITLFPNYDEAWVAENKNKIVAEWNKHLEDSM
ncbi:MAG: extracellular solute-binding protein [Cardiobacteriaceae bacterium]|nr:extracellular solute-binding protein [Cardiobacteriaceae bacterium]